MPGPLPESFRNIPNPNDGRFRIRVGKPLDLLRAGTPQTTRGQRWVPEEDVSGLAVGEGVHELLLQGVQGAVVHVDGAARPGGVTGALPAEGDVEVPLVGLKELHPIPDRKSTRLNSSH